MSKRKLQLVVMSSCVMVSAMTALAQEPINSAAFDRADRLSRTVIQQIRCARRVGALRQSGAFGPLDSLGGRGQCPTVNGRSVGVFFDADTVFARVSRFSAIDLTTSMRLVERLDTVAILAVARASRAAQLRGTDAYVREHRAYAPMAFRFDGDSIQVWLVPVNALTGKPFVLGGERGYVFSPDGRTLVSEIDHFDAVHPLVVPDTGIVRIPSDERVVPLITELIAANLLYAIGRPVSIETQSESATLTGGGPAGVWVHIRRKD